jgi:hypothetical protein
MCIPYNNTLFAKVQMNHIIAPGLNANLGDINVIDMQLLKLGVWIGGCYGSLYKK